jgi:Lantibiotic modifying enzyme
MKKTDDTLNKQDYQLVNDLTQIKDLLSDKDNIPLSPGLIDGKMGVVVFFFHYAEYVKEEKYKDYAIDLIEDVQNQISSSMPMNYVSGLTGIGTAIEYIGQQCMIDADTDDLLSDFDETFKSHLKERILYLSAKDIIDIGKYFQFRFANKEITSEVKKIMEQLVYVLSLHMDVHPKCSSRAVSWLSAFSKKYQSDIVTGLLEKLSDTSYEELSDNDLYLQQSAFAGLEILCQLDKRHLSWKEIL